MIFLQLLGKKTEKLNSLIDYTKFDINLQRRYVHIAVD